jgi:hypothetical protein
MLRVAVMVEIMPHAGSVSATSAGIEEHRVLFSKDLLPTRAALVCTEYQDAESCISKLHIYTYLSNT